MGSTKLPIDGFMEAVIVTADAPGDETPPPVPKKAARAADSADQFRQTDGRGPAKQQRCDRWKAIAQKGDAQERAAQSQAPPWAQRLYVSNGSHSTPSARQKPTVTLDRYMKPGMTPHLLPSSSPTEVHWSNDKPSRQRSQSQETDESSHQMVLRAGARRTSSVESSAGHPDCCNISKRRRQSLTGQPHCSNGTSTTLCPDAPNPGDIYPADGDHATPSSNSSARQINEYESPDELRRQINEYESLELLAPKRKSTKSTKSRDKRSNASFSNVTDAELLAKLAVERCDTSFATIQRVLELVEIPLSSHRANVIPVGESTVRGMLFGLYVYGGSVGLTLATQDYPWLTKLLCAAMRAHDPNFPFTSIQLNHNYSTRPHVDKNNLGCSYIVGFGGYQGGEVWMQDTDADIKEPPEDAVFSENVTAKAAIEQHKVVWHTLDKDGGNVTGTLRAGHSYPGYLADVNKKWTYFDGNKLHFTFPFTGNRYTMIFFTSDQFRRVEDSKRSQLNAAGFDFGWDRDDDLEDKLKVKLASRRITKELQRKEREELLLSRGRCMGRIWSEGWGQRCTGICAEDGQDFCTIHLARDKWRVHGRFDGDLPAAKKKEMRRCQEKMLHQGAKPPADEPWTNLVNYIDKPKCRIKFKGQGSSSVEALPAVPAAGPLAGDAVAAGEAPPAAPAAASITDGDVAPEQAPPAAPAVPVAGADEVIAQPSGTLGPVVTNGAAVPVPGG